MNLRKKKETHKHKIAGRGRVGEEMNRGRDLQGVRMDTDTLLYLKRITSLQLKLKTKFKNGKFKKINKTDNQQRLQST